MVRRRLIAFVLPVAVIGLLALAAPAHATPQSGLGMTLDVTIEPGTQSGLESTAWLPSGGGTAVVSTSANVTADTTMTITEGVTTIMSCTVMTGTNACGGAIPALTPGATNVTYTFDDGTDSVAFSGVLFTVTVAAPTITLEWQDVDGDWINGNSTALPLLGSATTVGRCVVTNNGNAPGTLSGMTGTVAHPSGPPTVTPLTATIPAGESQAFTLYTGPASEVSAYSCSGGINFPASTGGSGSGDSGAVVPIAGTLTSSALTIEPGGTVTITGDGLLPPMSSTFSVTVNGAPAAGSPITLEMPAGAIDFDVLFPTAGTYTLAVHNAFSTRTVTFATFQVTVVGAAELADSGVDETGTATVAGLLVLTGLGLLAIRRRARPDNS